MSMICLVTCYDQKNVDEEEDAIMAIFISSDDAHEFANELIKAGRSDVYVEERTLHSGQPNRLGWNL
jgi:hypothetical protein